MAVTTMVGARIHRREDPRLVRGQGRYSDDHLLAKTAFMVVVRSPHAHARVLSIDTAAASQAPGVVSVMTASDFTNVIGGTMPVAPAFVPLDARKPTPGRFPIAETEVCYQGEPVAVVVAETPYQAADAAHLVAVEWDPLPAVVDIEKALEAGSPPAHDGATDNVAWDLTFTADAD